MKRVSLFLLPMLLAPVARVGAQDADPAAAPAAQAPAHGPQLVGPTIAALSGGSVQVLFSNVATSTTSDVPGLAGAKFAGASVGACFDRPWVSRNGLHWAILADTNLATTEDQVVLVDGTVVEREGQPTPFFAGGTYGLFDVRIGLNDNGEYAVFNNLASTTTNDDYVVKVTAGPTHTVIAQESLAIGVLPGATYDDDLDSITLLNNGDVAFSADLIDGAGVVTTNDDDIYVIGNTLNARRGLTIPTGQAGGGMAAWDNFDFEDMWVDNSGNVLLKGDTLAATTDDQIVAYNNAVVLQENQIIAGSSFANPIDASGIVEVSMDHGGNWYARGNNDVTEQDWVVRNGVVIASEGSNVLGAPGRFRVLTGALNAAQVVPPSASTATGTATITLDTLENVLYYTVTTTGLTSAETAADIHGFAAAGANAPALFPLPLGTPKNGFVAYLEADEASILGGLTYVSIDTVGFPGGEVRGQLAEVTEVWDDRDFSDAFFLHVGDSQGNWVIGGTTNGNSTRNGVLVKNGTTEVAREGQPLDIDGNGLFDDDAFINTFGNDDAFLRDDGTFVFVATIRNAAGTQTGHGVFQVDTLKGPEGFCFGDNLDPNVSPGCPCGNFGAAGRGCASSFNANGARMTGTGSVPADTFTLQVDGVNATGNVIFMRGDLDNVTGVVFGDGVRCVDGVLRRRTKTIFSPNVSSFPLPTDTVTLSNGWGIGNDTPPGSGITAYYMAYYRNAAAAFCPPETFNGTNGFKITW
ncbi:MAG: CHRD domain-containing protein [Planctomycetes bacterium]|nr:CHRD domain-containing protein [Planctomycetota bacterium]